jgi:hypothetical protein
VDEPLTGSCLCGAVRITLTGAPERVGVCHCLDCRKKTGAVFATWAILLEDEVEVAGTTTRHELPNGYASYRCAACASPLYEKRPESGEVELLVGVLDEPSRLTPTYELWTIRRESWLAPLADADQYERSR